MSGAHAFLAPSSASTWGPGGCSAFPRMAAAFPEQEDTPEAREGEAAHWILERLNILDDVVNSGGLAPNGEIITPEMIEGAAQMAADVQALMTTADIGLEQTVTMPQISALNRGRADMIGVDMKARKVYAWDYKFGHGYVDAFENWQTFDYAIGAVNHFQVPLDDTWTFDTRIYQPRSYHKEGPVKRWEFGFAKYLELLPKLRAAAELALVPDSPMTTGPHCQHCPARHVCPAFIAVGGNVIDMSLRGNPLEMSAAGAGALLKMVRLGRERLEDLETGLEAVVLAAIREGKAVPGWTTEFSEPREKWTQPVADVVAMGLLMGVDLSKPAEAITPAQARKKGIDAAVISAYSTRPKGEMKLKPLDGKDVRKAFQ